MYYFMIALCVLFLILLLRVPIMIAKSRGIWGNNLTIIAILSWLGLIFGITWVIALIFALVWSGDADLAAKDLADMEKLDKLHKLKQRGAITQKEYDVQKRKILK
ncbi:MAG: SHOCT domain-containing protein [Alphaproteobacteria bacterium]|nr:SHOCT domain-containing protein [Alphaproteobacteria bacterium]